MTRAGHDIVSLGEPMYEFSQIPGREREYLQGFGGDTMNCAIAAARLGARVAYITRVGDDEFARQLFELWKHEGVDASAVKSDPDAHTAVYFISHTANGHHFSYLRKNSAASRLSPGDVPEGTIRGARFFYTSGITQAISESACEAVSAAIDIARAAGTQVVFDANYRTALWTVERARKTIRATLSRTDLFLLSFDDARLLCDSDEPEVILDWCAAAGARVAILKLGGDGVIYRDASGVRKVNAWPVDAVDATGAGDCFAGALMVNLSIGAGMDSACRFAGAAAALACTGYGAIDPLPDAAQVMAFMACNG